LNLGRLRAEFWLKLESLILSGLEDFELRAGKNLSAEIF